MKYKMQFGKMDKKTALKLSAKERCVKYVKTYCKDFQMKYVIMMVQVEFAPIC